MNKYSVSLEAVVSLLTHVLCSGFKLCRLLTQTHFPSKTYTVYFLMARHTVLNILPGSSKSLCIYFFFLLFIACHLTLYPKTNHLFFHFLKILCFGDGTWDQVRFHVSYIYTFRRSTFLFTDHIMYFFFFYYYCDDNCVTPKKPLSDAFLRRWLFGESEVSTCHWWCYCIVFLLFYHTCFFSCYQQSIFH